jgi:uncharacterized protein YlbG (UPF0298 family)
MSYANAREKLKNKKETVSLPINIDMLNTLLQYVLSDNSLVTKKSLINLRILVNYLDMDEYKDDYARLVRIEFIKKVLEGILDQNLHRDAFIEDYCLKELPTYAKEIKELLDSGEYNEFFSNDEVLFVNNYVEQNLTYIYLYKHSDGLENALQQLKLSDVNSLKRLNAQFEKLIDGMYRDIKSAKATNKFAAMDFSIGGNNADVVVRSTIEELRKPNNHMKMGLKQLNAMLDGGLENGRTYLFFGLPKGFKSGTLLNIGIWACKYNKNAVTKDPTKKPCVLYVTQENSIRETMQRIFVYSTGKSIAEYDENEALRIIREEIIGESDVDFFIKYRPNKTISTTDLDAMCEDLELEGYEVITLIQDYTKRIRSANYNPDIRLELGNVVDDFTVIAKSRNIPVVSAGQLNREAYRILETALQKGRTNIGKDLNASHVGESALMIENTDYGIIVNKEEDITTKEEFLTFKLIASRAKKPKVTYFAHPFENGLRLQEDVTLSKSLSIERIGDNLKDFDPNNARKNIFGDKDENQPNGGLNLGGNMNLPPNIGDGIDFGNM